MEELEKIIDAIAPEQEQQQQPQEIPLEQEPKSPSAQHFKTVKQLQEKAERERDEAIRQLAEFKSKQQPDQDIDFTIGNDEIAEGKHLLAMDRKIKNLEKKLSQQQQQSAESLIETRLKMEFPDIESVVTKENIDMLTLQEPEIVATINSATDYYSKAKTVYKLMKKFGIVQDTHYQADRDRVQANAIKPRPLTSINPQQAESPLSRVNAFANGLTDELKSELYKEMKNSMR